MGEVEYRLLGPVALLRDGEPVPVGGSTTLTLLAGLLLSADQVVSGERLAQIVWAERQPARPRSALHSAISRLRRSVGGGVLEGVPTGYRLRVGPDRLDLSRSTRLADAADAAQRHGRLDEAASALREALALWRGRPLGNIESAALQADAAGLAEKHLALHERHADLCLRLERHAAVVELLTPLVAAQPFRERLVGQLMLALFRGGRQAEALAAYEALSRSLREELGIFPSAWLRDLHVRILRADDGLEREHPSMTARQPADAPGPARALHLPHETGHAPAAADAEAPVRDEPAWRGLRPPPQPLVGRDREVEELCRTVLASRAVTLVGTAGVGKTSVALKAAERLAAGFRGGVAVVELGTLAASGQGRVGASTATTGAGLEGVAEAVRRALSVREGPGPGPGSGPGTGSGRGLGDEEVLTAALRRTQLLLVLDTAEHVADECGRLVDLLTRSCPEVSVLTTSRRPLGIAAEAVVELSPLEPALAVRLLRQRMVGHRPGLDPSADPDGLAELCRQVDGLPLAIELAALRLRTMSLRALLRRIGRQRGLLAGSNGARLPHQRGLETTLQWSYNLLTRPARLLLCRLASFEGCFTLEEAERASGYAPLDRQEVAGLLGDLVEQCVVQTARGGDGYSYRLLASVRRFVLDPPEPIAAPAPSGA